MHFQLPKESIMTNSKHLAVLCGLSALALACNKEAEREPASARNETIVERDEPHATMAPASRTRSAAEQISRARCEREQQCGNIGADQTFSSAQDCLVRIQNDWKGDLDSRQCPGGINQQELDECMSEIRSEDCGNPFDTLARITECTKSQICIEEP
jgi:hypothetical protein